MSDQELPRQIRDLSRRLEQTQVIERPGASGQTTFYATGTYTPTYTGGSTAGTTTYLIQEGEYTRVGRIVHCNGRLNWSAATGTGEARISLPFTVGGTYRSTGAAFVDGVTFANSTPMPLIVPGQAYFTLYSPLTNAAPTVVAVESAGLIIWNVAYYVG